MKIHSCLVIILLSLTSQVICIKLSARKDTNVDDEPFLMELDLAISNPQGINAIVSGKILRGKVKPGDEVEIVYRKNRIFDVVENVKGFGQKDEYVRSGEAQVALKSFYPDDFYEGMVLAQPGSIKTHAKFEADMEFIKKEDGVMYLPLFKGKKRDISF